MRRKIDARRWFRLIKGAIAFETLADAPVDVMRRVLNVCAACPARRIMQEDELYAEVPGLSGLIGHPPATMWCGEPGVPDREGGTCGCLLAREAVADDRVDVTIKGRRLIAAGKAQKRGVACPREWWKVDKRGMARIDPAAPSLPPPPKDPAAP